MMLKKVSINKNIVGIMTCCFNHTLVDETNYFLVNRRGRKILST